jgi:hypothetical protein
MNDVARALGRALASQFHPRMLWLAVWPFLVALVAWGVLGFVFRQGAVAWLVDVATGSWIGHWIATGFSWLGLDDGLGFMMGVVWFGIVFAAMVLTALLIIATVAMPTVVAHVASRDYPTLAAKHGGSYLGSLGNALWVGIAFVIGFVLTIPLWLVAPFAFLVPLFWWGWSTARMFRYDALVAHASDEERRTLVARHGRAFLAIGMIVSLLNFVPPLFFIVPILGGLAFTHYALHALAQLRAEQGGSGINIVESVA